MTGPAYRHWSGIVYFVSDGISGGKAWAAYTRKPNGSLKRCRSRALPVCSTPEEAQANLDAWAARWGMQPIGGGEHGDAV